jgi:hypothetical protein
LRTPTRFQGQTAIESLRETVNPASTAASHADQEQGITGIGRRMRKPPELHPHDPGRPGSTRQCRVPAVLRPTSVIPTAGNLLSALAVGSRRWDAVPRNTKRNRDWPAWASRSTRFWASPRRPSDVRRRPCPIQQSSAKKQLSIRYAAPLYFARGASQPSVHAPPRRRVTLAEQPSPVRRECVCLYSTARLLILRLQPSLLLAVRTWRCGRNPLEFTTPEAVPTSGGVLPGCSQTCQFAGLLYSFWSRVQGDGAHFAMRLAAFGCSGRQNGCRRGIEKESLTNFPLQPLETNLGRRRQCGVLLAGAADAISSGDSIVNPRALPVLAMVGRAGDAISIPDFRVAWRGIRHQATQPKSQRERALENMLSRRWEAGRPAEQTDVLPSVPTVGRAGSCFTFVRCPFALFDYRLGAAGCIRIAAARLP